MSDSYQAIYDAVRSRISGGNVGEIVADACRSAFDISHLKYHLQEDFSIAAREMARPCVLFKPTIQADGNMWTVLLGPDPMIGVFATGATPAEAMANWDQEFWKGLTQVAAAEQRIAAEEAREAALANGQFGVGA
jgi:hypothetical protein